MQHRSFIRPTNINRFASSIKLSHLIKFCDYLFLVFSSHLIKNLSLNSKCFPSLSQSLHRLRHFLWEKKKKKSPFSISSEVKWLCLNWYTWDTSSLGWTFCHISFLSKDGTLVAAHVVFRETSTNLSLNTDSESFHERAFLLWLKVVKSIPYDWKKWETQFRGTETRLL